MAITKNNPAARGEKQKDKTFNGKVAKPVKYIGSWLGLGNLRRYKKEGYIGGIAEMIANLIYNKPSSYRLLQIRFLVLAIIILAPEGAGLFMYLFLWAIIPKESDKERQERNDRHKKMRKLSKDLANVYQARNKRKWFK